jgi:predicted CopG family antitoxin
MMARNIAISDPAYERLLRLKRKGESFSDVVLRIAPSRPSIGEVLRKIREMGPVDMDDVLKDISRQRKERERRAARIARAIP